MKHNFTYRRGILRRVAAAALAAAMLATTAGAAAFGSFLRQDGLELSDTARMVRSQRKLASGGQLTENLLTYSPESALRPMVAYGTTLYGRSDLDYVAKYLSGAGKTAAAGVNGSFFTMANGVPMGPVITEGIVRSSTPTGNAVGFRDDGTSVIGQPKVTIRAAFPNGQTSDLLYNKVLSKVNGMVLYSGDYDRQTRNTLSAYNVLLQPDSDRIIPGKTVRAKVTAILKNIASCDIPSGGFVLSMATDTDYPTALNTQLATLKVGDTVTLSCTVARGWEDVTYACGADELLVEDGQARTTFLLDSAKRRAARTAAGLRADGTLVLYTADYGGSGYSAGLTLEELAARMAELDCVIAVNLDGGGSTTFSACYPGNSALTTVNRPSDGSQRRCANFIFLARDTTAPGDAAHLHVYPCDAAVLAGGRLRLSCKATDANYNPADVPLGLTYSATGGTVSEAGVFTAGDAAGLATVEVRGGGASGTRTIRVSTDPTSITLRNEATGQAVTSVTVPAGGTLDLQAVAVQAGYTLVSQDDCFIWTASPGIGQIDQNGKLTAATAAASGTVTCSAGSAKATISVAVTASAQQAAGDALCAFEPDQTAATSGTGLAVAVNRSLAYVRYGAGSLQAKYDLAQGTAMPRRQVRAGLDAARLPADADTAGLWLYGDNSNNSFSLLFSVDGETVSKWVTQLNFSGWKYVSAAIPEGASAVTGFAVTEYEDATAAAGTLYLDQLTASKGPLDDVTSPAISVSQSAGQLNVSVTDGGSGVGQVLITLDGQAQSAAVSDGKASLALPQDGKAHQVRVTAADRCGNLASKTVTIDGALDNPFTDLDGHWSKFSVDYCYRQKILSGSADSSGRLRYRPDDRMTRQEFAAALIRFLGVDASKYASVTLPFADSARIADWARDAMKAAYSLGLITGSSSGGQRYANPTQTITRQEAVSILSRTQPKGYAEASLSGFSDAASVGAWARSDLACMVSRGVISGSNGRLFPTGSVTRGQVAAMLYALY